MRKLSIELTEEEMDAIHRFAPMIDAIRHIIPQGLLSVVHKVEKAIKDHGSSEPQS